MRKDVKLGLAIGGIFLAVLVVYLLAVSGGSSTPQQVTLDTQDAATASAAQPAPVDSKPQPAPQAAALSTPAPLPVPAATPPAPATQQIAMAEPARSDAPSAAPAEDKWTVLYTGMPLSTQTPDARPAADASATEAPATLPTPASSNPPSNVKYAVSEIPADPSPGASIVVPPPLAGGMTKHVIARGETFSTIAAVAYGKASYYKLIMDANPTVQPNALKPGMTINLPPASQVKTSQTTAAVLAAPNALDSKSEYRVESGDSLYKISQKLYGRGDRMEKLYDLNKSLIGPNKQALKVGMVLKLPEAPNATH